MNTTQRKYAVNRLTTLAAAQMEQIKEDDKVLVEQLNTLAAFTPSMLKTVRKDVTSVKPGMTLDSVFDLTEVKKKVEAAQEVFRRTHGAGKFEHKIPGEGYYRSITVFFSESDVRLTKTTKALQTAVDAIMLGNESTALEAIKNFENRKM